jgi:hypothetical protein
MFKFYFQKRSELWTQLADESISFFQGERNDPKYKWNLCFETYQHFHFKNNQCCLINFHYSCCWNLKLRYGTLRQFIRKQCFIVPAQTQWTRVQRLRPENKGVSPYISLPAGYRSRMQSSTHIWLHVTLLAISFPQCYVTFMFQLFKFYLPALPSLPPASLSEHSLSVSVLVLLPATSLALPLL